MALSRSPVSVRDPEVTRERILDAAEQAIRRFGFRRASMNDVAAMAHVSRGSVYRYFPDRDALVTAVLERLAQRFVASSEASVRRRRTLAAQVGEAAVFIRTHLDDALLTLTPPGEDDTLLAALLTTQIEGLLAEFVDFWQPFLADAQARGEIRAGLDRRRAAEWIVRVMVSFVVMPSVVVDLDNPEAVRSFVQDHIIRGLAP